MAAGGTILEDAPLTTPGRLGRFRRTVPGRILGIKLAAFGLSFITVAIVGALFAPFLTPYDPNDLQTFRSELPSGSHLLGTDVLGRDQLTRLLFGARASLQVSFLATALAVSVGSTVGLVSAYFKGIVDTVLMRTVDALLSLPGLVLPLTLLAVLGGGILTVSLAIGIAFMPSIARLMRGQALAQLERDYVLAAVSSGASRQRIMFRHVAPNTMAPIIVAASLGMSGAVIAEAGLSFLGVGVNPPTATWGTMLSTGFSYLRTSPWVVFAPGIAIFLLVLSFNFVGDALRDVLDPRLRGAV